jgi:hypothetical protein
MANLNDKEFDINNDEHYLLEKYKYEMIQVNFFLI